MSQWIEADTSKTRRRLITEKAGNVCVRSFVKSDGNKNWQ